jgi:hypothetical protein
VNSKSEVCSPLQLRDLMRKSKTYIVLALFPTMGFLSIDTESTIAFVNEAGTAAQLASNSRLNDSTTLCPTNYKFDEQTGQCTYGYIYCPDGLTLNETSPIECPDGIVKNATAAHSN